MSRERGVEMSPEEVDAFLGRGGTGVLSLARGDEPYATPVSYGYDRNARQFLLRLGFGSDAGKSEFVESDGGARLVSYRPVEGGWTSVIASGDLVAVDDDSLTVDTVNVLREAALPLVEVWGEKSGDVEFRVYRLEAEELTGRTTARG